MARPSIAGYAFGTSAVPRSPVSLAEFELMKETALFGEDDVRYLPTMMYALLSTLKPFLAKNGHSAADVDAMHAAWGKSLVLQVTLWCHPYVNDGDY